MKLFSKRICVPLIIKFVYADSSNALTLAEDAPKSDSNNSSKTKKVFERYSGVPLFSKEASHYKKEENVLKEAVTFGAINNPGVIIGLGLTTIALLGMFQKSYTGDRLGAQKFMRYRIMAQFFTVFALIAGVIYFVNKLEKKNKENERK